MKDIIMKKLERGEPLTAEEVEYYEKMTVKSHHVYGKYGTLAKRYLKEHNVAKYWVLGEDLPDYLHGVDRQAELLYDTMYKKLSSADEYKKNGEFLHDLRIEEEIRRLIDEEILNEIVYV